MNQNKLKSDFLHIAFERGFIHQATDLEALDALMAKQSITGYAGFDPTGESLHVGHLMPIMWLRWMQKPDCYCRLQFLFLLLLYCPWLPLHCRVSSSLPLWD